jgi:hypothetical protein
MQDSAAAQQEILDRFKEELEAIAHRWGDDAKGKAERTLNAALAASKEAMAKGMQDGAKAAAEAVRRELGAATAQLAAPIREARRVPYMNMVAAGMAVVGRRPGPVGLAVDGDAGSHRQKWRWSTAPAASPAFWRGWPAPCIVGNDGAAGCRQSAGLHRQKWRCSRKKPGSAGLSF